MDADASLKEKHDELLENMPEGASHDKENCPFCNPSGGGDEMNTFTEDELNTAVAEALAPVKEAAEAEISRLKDEIAELSDAQAADEAAEVEERITSLQTDLDKAEARASEAEARVEEILSWLEEQATLAEIAEYLTAVRAERTELIRSAAHFSDEYIDANIDRWSSMSDEAFAALVADMEAIKEASKGSLQETSEHSDDKPPAETAFENTRSDSKPVSAGLVWSARRDGIDVRTF